MPYEVQLNEQMGIGFAAHSTEKGEDVEVILSAFATDENGLLFYKYIEAFEKEYLGPFLEQDNTVATIDHFLVLINKDDNKAIVYVNELPIIINMVPKRPLKHGEGVYKNDIAGLLKINFGKLSIPKDSAIVFYFSVGWRRGVFFDFRPLPPMETNLENVESQLASCYEYLLFYELYSLKESDWPKLYSYGWFPFISIQGPTLHGLMSRIAEGRQIKSSELEIINSFGEEKLKGMLESFRQKSFLQSHIPMLEAGIERYLAGDYISSINNIWPRVEGLLRFAYPHKVGHRPGQRHLVDYMRDTMSNELSPLSVFFPQRFRDYLLAYYFKDFDIPKGNLSVSRHAIGHGVSDPKTYDQKRALLGILMVDQIAYYLSLTTGFADST